MGLLSKWKRVLAASLTLGLVGSAAVLLTPADATSGFQFVRPFNGPNRYDTARLVAVNSFLQNDNALIATGTDFPDALAASYLAGSLGAPVLLTDPNGVPVETALALQTLKTKNVTILGGTSAVSPAVESQLRSAGLFVDRIAGANRYQTALEIAKRPLAHHVGSLFNERTAIVASGANFADALAGGPIAYAQGFPILLTPPDSLGPDAHQGFRQLGIQRVLLLGGTGAVSANVENQIKSLSINVNRIGGDDRTHTATLLADFAIGNLGFSTTHVNLANGATGVDALAAGPHAGRERAPILLTASADSLDTGKGANTEYLFRRSPTLQFGHVFGGSSAISDDVVQRAAFAAGALPPEGPSGQQTVTVFQANIGERYFISTSGRTFRYGFAGDTYQIQGVNSNETNFAAVLSPGDVIDTNYNPSHANPSTFHVTQDTVPTPVITSVTRSGPAVEVHYQVSPLRSIGTVYQLQRSSSALPACLGPFGPFSSVAQDDNYDGIVVDPAPPSGCHQYRIIAFTPVPGAGSAASAPTANVQV
ncbi:MAG TPA: cell wall-binding repeat-containing protein [Nocardioidaceae bacterium]|nr:cell wall-binding repeat-containing protein [Nocardioidaceae bacterium]